MEKYKARPIITEKYLVAGVYIEFFDKQKKAILYNNEHQLSVEGTSRHDLLVKVGDAMRDTFNLDNGAIMGLYNVVPIKQ